MARIAVVSVCVFTAICGLVTASPVRRGAVAALAQQAQVFQGSWTASVGSGGPVYRGTWSGETSSQTANSVQGSWTLVNDAGEIILQGTWTARKFARNWQGTWSARAASGSAYSGTWDADLGDSTGKTLEDMLKRTIEKQVAGSWRSGRYQGFWWLDGTVPKPARR